MAQKPVHPGTSTAYDVIVVGLGAMGSATCYHLAKRGQRVLGLEHFDIPHALGSSHGFSRLIRLAYHEHPNYVPLLRTAYSEWHRLETESHLKLLYITGGLYAGPPHCKSVAGAMEAARIHHLPYDALDNQAIAKRFPQVKLPPDFVAMFEHNAGFLLVEKCIGAMADQAMRHGAELHGREPVIGWEAGSGGVSVTTPRGVYRAGKLVFCGGAWSGKILNSAAPALAASLRVTRQVLGWVWPRKFEQYELGRFPVWAIEDGHTPGTYYGFPMMSECPGFKLALHYPATAADPDTVERGVLDGDEETFRSALRRFFPDADGPLLSLKVCLYTNSPDSHFIIDRLPGEDRVIVACGFSGHGFKFATAIGHALSDLAADGGTALPIQFLGLKRFLATKDR